MADRETEVVAKLAGGVSGLNAAAWDRLAGNDPFVSHAFLSALEQSGSVGKGTGWTPATLLIEDGNDRLAAAAPAYLKTHSQGEYVFDHAWADAFERAGGSYYPKLQIAVPFTPVPGPRLLGDRPQHLLAAAEAVVVQNDISSAHVTFLHEAD
jgi:predicted N-acyltransferase